VKIIDNNLKERLKHIEEYKKYICETYKNKSIFQQLYKIKDIEKCKTIAKKEINKEAIDINDIMIKTLIHLLFIRPYIIFSHIDGKCNVEEWKKEWGNPKLKKLSIRKLKKIFKKEKWDKLELQTYCCLWVGGGHQTTVIIEK